MSAGAALLPAGATIERRRVAWSLVLGTSEAASGLLLVTSPALLLRLLAIEPPAGDGSIYLRFVGVFVTCVGLAYLAPLTLGGPGERRLLLAAALAATAAVRLAVALFVGLAVMAGALAEAWLLVGLYDAVVGIGQLALVNRERAGDGG